MSQTDTNPTDPKDRFIDLVAMKNYAAHVGFPPGLDFWTRLELATAWAAQRDHEGDTQRAEYFA